MRQKFDAKAIIPKLFSMVKTQFNTRIKKFRYDNAPELNFHEYFDKKGVTHQFSYVKRPKQNFVVERKHQHLLSVARALLFQSRVLISFKGSRILTATFLINRISAPILKN